MAEKGVEVVNFCQVRGSNSVVGRPARSVRILRTGAEIVERYDTHDCWCKGRGNLGVIHVRDVLLAVDLQMVNLNVESFA